MVMCEVSSLHRKAYEMSTIMSKASLFSSIFGELACISQKTWRISAGRNKRLFSSSVVSSNTPDSVRIDDAKLVKAIVYEANKNFCDSTGSTTKFSEFLSSQLSIHAAKREHLDTNEMLQDLVLDAKLYSQMNHKQRVDLLDRVARIQGFSSARDIVEHEVAVAEAAENLQDGEVQEESEKTSRIIKEAVVYGSSEPIDLFNFKKPCNQVISEESDIDIRTQVNVEHKESTGERRDSTVEYRDCRVESTIECRESTTRSRLMNRQASVPGDWKLDTPICELKCLTAYQRGQLQESGFYTARSLLNHFPRAHISFESPTDTLEDGQVVGLLGTIVQTKVAQLKSNLTMLEVIVYCNIGQDCLRLPSEDENEDKSVFLHVKKFFQGARFRTGSWFMNRLSSSYPEGSKAVVSGKVKAMKVKRHFDIKDYDLKVIHEDFTQLQKEREAYPVYPSKGLLHPKKIQTYIQRMLADMPPELDPLPHELRTKYELVSLEQAYLGLHQPATLEEANIARRRIVFDDYFYLQLAFLLQRQVPLENLKLEALNVLEMESWCPLCLRVVNALPFKLTAGQIKAASEIMWDLRQAAPMSRLLQGDVGCGKTIVAFLALLDVVNSGFQGALMAPTEFVVSQHYQQFISWLELLDEKERPSIGLLSGSMSQAEARITRERIANKEISLVLGTHALISGTTNFPALGLAVIDEQHKFGVVQRDRLKMTYTTEAEVSENESSEDRKVKLASTTHVLLMSATPIPRSLALTVHGDMNLSQITEIPPGRVPTETRVFANDDVGRKTAYDLIREELERGGRAFFVYPLIAESNAYPSHKAAVQEFERVANEFKDYKCALVHGRMKPDARNEEMKKFRGGECQIMVSTKVIEVGIDVSEATIMLIENAEAYGLAQLHQLRGRVGRGKKKSYCVLISSCTSALERLKLLESTNDGFQLAEADLRMRGPGDLLGKRQSGAHLEFVLARLGEDNDILEQARNAASEFLETCSRNLDDYPKLKQEINMRQLPKSWS